MFEERDSAFMREALALADRVKGTTIPNPAVGAVIVQGDTVVGRGATQPAGGPHAEVVALREAGALARGATAYVTLEPCNHVGLTPPCTAALVEAGVATVFASVKDPNPLVRGKGIRLLRGKGITVHTGLLEKEASRLNEDFFWSITRRRPWLTLKLAFTLDGQIADLNGHSRWITNHASRRFVHDLRRRHAAIAVGGATVVADDPQLTVRHVAGPSPARIVFTSHPARLRRTNIWTTAGRIRSIAVTPGGKAGAKRKLVCGVEQWYTGERDEHRHMLAFLDMAYGEKLSSILIEGGRHLASSFLEHDLVNRLWLFYGNRLIGGGLSGIEFAASLPLPHAIRLDGMEITPFADNICITGIPRRMG
jgi:diaminohydroxyphosphoribosylaminopyrimidine deaminase/5-amino-6-(5-phosphoribosylamino)uracil reductase